MNGATLLDKPPIVDAHLDLAENVTLFGRDLTLNSTEIRVLEKRTTRQATVSLPDLERGSIAVAMATVTAGFVAQDVGEDFEQGLDLKFPRVCASHANAQALTPTDRHLSNEVICAVAERKGVIGLVLI